MSTGAALVLLSAPCTSATAQTPLTVEYAWCIVDSDNCFNATGFTFRAAEPGNPEFLYSYSMTGFWTGSSFAGLGPSDYRWYFGLGPFSGEWFGSGSPVFGGQTAMGSRAYNFDIVGRTDVWYEDVAFIAWNPVGGIGGDCNIAPTYPSTPVGNCVATPVTVSEPPAAPLTLFGLLAIGLLGWGRRFRDRANEESARVGARRSMCPALAMACVARVIVADTPT